MMVNNGWPIWIGLTIRLVIRPIVNIHIATVDTLEFQRPSSWCRGIIFQRLGPASFAEWGDVRHHFCNPLTTEEKNLLRGMNHLVDIQ